MPADNSHLMYRFHQATSAGSWQIDISLLLIVVSLLLIDVLLLLIDVSLLLRTYSSKSCNGSEECMTGNRTQSVHCMRYPL